MNKDFHVSVRNTETWITLKFSPTSSRYADVLFIVDDSGRMSTHQKNLVNNVQLITSALSSYISLNAAVLTTTTYVYSGSTTTPSVFVGGVINSTQPDFMGLLSMNLIVGTQGDYTERPFQSLWNALSEPLISTANKGFLRDNADLYLVFLTDTQDQSELDETQIFSLLKTLKPTQTVSILAGMVTDPNTCSGESWELNNKPPKIQNLVSLTGGSVFSLCDDFSKNLTDAIKTTIVTEKSLTLPIVDNKKIQFSSLNVIVDGQAIPAGDIHNSWYFDSTQSVLYFSDNLLNWASGKGPMTIQYKVE